MSGTWSNWEEAAGVFEETWLSARYWRARSQLGEKELGMRLGGVLGVDGLTRDEYLGNREQEKALSS